MTEASTATHAKPHVIVLGGGPAGLAAAYRLTREGKAKVTLVERQSAVGGNAGSFELEGVWCDHGSHRLHPVVEPRIMEDIKSLLGDELLWRPRHGRILLQGTWIHFPLKPVDLALRLPKAFAARLAFDSLKKMLPKEQPAEPSFATVLESGLGPTMSEAFYFPYVRKLWGLAPEALAVKLAQRRVSGSSVTKLLGKVLRQVPGFGAGKASGFYYPKRGFGMISDRLREAAEAQGATILLDTAVTRIDRDGDRVTAVHVERDGQSEVLHGDAVWSSLPLTALTGMLEPGAPSEVRQAAQSIRFRGMILIYLVLETEQFTEYDAHYFPELSVPISRMSETKNYHDTREPQSRTVLCAELPSDPDQPEWSLDDDALGKLFCEWLASVGLPVEVPVVRTVTRRLRQAYPVYDRAYEPNFDAVDQWLLGFDNLLSYGRQGLFAHDNTHHAMTMAYAASDCLQPDGSFDWVKWAEHREAFESHVVED